MPRMSRRLGALACLFLLDQPGAAAPPSPSLPAAPAPLGLEGRSLEGESAKRARHLLDSGDWEGVLALPSTPSLDARLIRAEALLESSDHQAASALLEGLSSELAPASPEQLFRFTLLRAGAAEMGALHEQAERGYREARRLAASAEQEMEALDSLIAFYRGRERWQEAQATLEQCEALLAQLGSDFRLAQHLSVVASLQKARGRRAEALGSLSAAGAIYKSLAMPIRAARIKREQSGVLMRGGDFSSAWDMAALAMAESLAIPDPEGVYSSAGLLTTLAYRLPKSQPRTAQLLREAWERLPSGVWRDAVEIDALRFDYQISARGEQPREALQAVLKRPGLGPDGRVRALGLLVEIASRSGDLAEAQTLISQALEVAEGQTIQQDRSIYGRGPLLLSQATLLREHHRYEESLQLVQRAVAAQPGEEWRPWRVVAGHYQALLSLLPLQDLGRARQELAEALLEADELTVDQQANFLTAVLAALSVNQAVAGDVLEPATLILGDYDPMARALLGEMLAPPGAMEKYLRVYDRWLLELRDGGWKDRWLRALGYRAMFLEAAGRLPEARAQLLEAAEAAAREQSPQMVAQACLLLARLESVAGHPEAALAALQRGRSGANLYSPGGRRLYYLVLAALQRQLGRPQEALESYQVAIDADPSRGWAGLFGRARAHQELGASAQAEAELRQALASPEVAGRAGSLALLTTSLAEVLQDRGEGKAALALYEQAFPSVLELASPSELSRAAQDYARALSREGREAEALAVARSALDNLLELAEPDSEWSRPLFEMVATLALATGQRELALRYLDLSRSAELVSAVKLGQVAHADPDTRALLSSLDDLRTRLEGLRREAAQTEEQTRRAALSQALNATRAEFFAKLDELKRREPDFEALVQLTGSDLSAVQAGLGESTALLEYFPARDSLYIFVVTRSEFRLHQVAISRADLAKSVASYARLLRDPDSDVARLAVASQALHDLLVQPVAPYIAKAETLLVAPSGPLWDVAFEELRDSQGQAMDERFAVALLSSADLVRSLSRPADKQTPGKAFVVGAPERADLPGASQELTMVHRMLPGSTLLEGEKATSVALVRAAPESELLHIASHSGLGALTSDSYISLEDGPFRLGQIYGLSLPRGALVVLSSCRSALGEAAPGREVTSLASAFAIAGASSVIASHWEVDDQATGFLFQAFYGALKEGKSRGEALRRARRETARRFPHPYYWAAFSLFGSPE